MRLAVRKATAPEADAPVTMLELFFDLVFVFVITQLTSLITGTHGWTGYAHAGLVLVVTWWMYSGFAWLTNNVAPTTTSTRLPMLLAMTCFLAIAVVVPDAFGSGAWIVAVAYLIIVTIHAVQFSRSALGESATAIRQVLPVNFGAAALLFVAAALGPDHGIWAWVAILVVVPFGLSQRHGDFTIRVAHFAERHQLLVIIALGETIIATGVSAQGSLTHLPVLLAMVLAIVVISALWSVYFGCGDDERGLALVERAHGSERTRLAARAYSYLHIVHIAGLVLLAVALHEAVHHPGERLEWTLALTMSAGVAIFLLAQLVFRRLTGIGPVRLHGAAAVLVLAVLPLGATVSGLAQLGALAVILAALAAALGSAGHDAAR